MDSDELLISLALVLRMLAPLLMLSRPLAGMVAALSADVADDVLLEGVAGFEPRDKHPYDKPLDTYYLAIAYIVVLRSWTDPKAVRIARVLWYWRLSGFAMYLVTDQRAVFVLCPAAFEFFFLAYAATRTPAGRWLAGRGVVALAAAAVALKLPQEFWLHVLRGETTDFFKQRVLGGDPSLTRWEIVTGRPHLALIVAAGMCITVPGWRRLRRAHPAARVNGTAMTRPAAARSATELDGEIAAMIGTAGACILLVAGALPGQDQQAHVPATALCVLPACALLLTASHHIGRRILGR